MDCARCQQEYAANWMSGWPGGYSAPGPMLVFSLGLAFAAIVFAEGEVGEAIFLPWVLLGLVVVGGALGLAQSTLRFHDR